MSLVNRIDMLVGATGSPRILSADSGAFRQKRQKNQPPRSISLQLPLRAIVDRADNTPGGPGNTYSGRPGRFR